MRRFLLSVILLTFSLPTISHSQSPIIQSIIDQTSIDSLIYFSKELSGEVSTIIGGAPYTIISRNKYQPSNDMAADYIEQRLEYYGLSVYNQQFGSSGRNVYGVQIGSEYPNKQYIICAHYDDMPNGTIAPGADDNASGTAAVLEAARIFSQYVSEYSIIYALWDEEEQGLICSKYYAQLAQSEGDSIMGVINLDMIAWDSNSDFIADLHTRAVGTSIYLKDKMIEVNSLYNIGLNIDIKNPGSTYSDHAAFWNYNVGAILLIEDGTDFNNYYHSTNDLVIHFNTAYYLRMSKTANGTLASLVNASGTIPVELTSFSGYAMLDRVRLDWTTASELNNLGFEIERSIDRNAFVTIGFVEGKGSSTVTNKYSYTDHPIFITEDVLYYRLKQLDYDGQYQHSQVIKIDNLGPLSFSLDQNYPNPFNPSTTIKYSIPESADIKLSVYNLVGEEVAVLKDGFAESGRYEIIFSAQSAAGGLPSGIYFYKLQAGNFVQLKKMTLMK